jgi:hypothetical protein
MSEALEIQQIVEHLQGVLENLITRGLRAAGASERNALATLGTEFTRVGAGHLAEHVAALNQALETDARDGPERLLRAQVSLRLFARILTLDVASASLKEWQAVQEKADGPEAE